MASLAPVIFDVVMSVTTRSNSFGFDLNNPKDSILLVRVTTLSNYLLVSAMLK
jgi:hypothetical protein